MKGMEELQHAFGNYLTGADTTVHGTVAEDDKADLKECMDLYAGTYRARMAESLGVDFPCLWAMIRDEQFYQLCLDYIRHHPSTFSSIHLFGSHMVDFLRERTLCRLFPGGGNGGVRVEYPAALGSSGPRR